MGSSNEMIGESAAFQATLRAANLIAASDVTTLIQGESGTGKELLAHAMHASSPRAQHPFITINCAALPENLVESEIFGHRKGAFSGAVCDQAGRAQQAHNGTLFLDEVGELPLNIQAKLLRLLENGECQPLGQATTETVNVRIIAATNRDLSATVQHGEFRQDLYYRLNVVPVMLPPLRERSGDVRLLIEKLTEQLAAQHQLIPPVYSQTAINALETHHWPGNVRELRNLCERMLILLSNQTVTAQNLPAEIRQPPTSTTNGDFTLPESGIELDSLEANMIQQALDKVRGNQSKAARLLGLSRGTLIYRMKKYAIA